MYLKRNLERKGIFTNIQLHLFPQLWGGHGNPFQYSCLENRMDRESWQATFHRATQSWTWLKQLSRNASIVSGLQSFYLSKTIYSKAEQSTQHSLADCYIWMYPHFLAKIRCGMGDPRGHSGEEPTCWWTQAPSPGWDNPQEQDVATHSSILAWKIPWTGEPAGLQSTGSHRVGRYWASECRTLYPCNCHPYQMFLHVLMSYTVKF